MLVRQDHVTRAARSSSSCIIEVDDVTFDSLTRTPLDMSALSLESELERAEALQKSDVSKAEKGYRTVLDRKARE